MRAVWVLDYWCEGGHSATHQKAALFGQTVLYLCVCVCVCVRSQSGILSGFHTPLWYSPSPWGFDRSATHTHTHTHPAPAQHGTLHTCEPRHRHELREFPVNSLDLYLFTDEWKLEFKLQNASLAWSHTQSKPKEGNITFRCVQVHRFHGTYKGVAHSQSLWHHQVDILHWYHTILSEEDIELQ